MKDNDINDVGNVSAALKEVARMDAVLRMKQVEKEKAIVTRTKMERNSLNLLMNSINSDIPDAFKINITAFLKFTRDSDSRGKTKIVRGEEEVAAAGDDDEYGIDRITSKKTSTDIKRVKNVDRIGRNIQLAKCGRGVLSVTDQERKRIDRLLQDAEFDDFSPDEAAKAVLEGINDRLQVLHKKRRKGPPHDRVLNINEPKLRESSLKQINASLEELELAAKKEVYPLKGEQMKALIKEANAEIPRPDMSPETLVRLVTKAKKSTPKFVYKWPGNTLEVT